MTKVIKIENCKNCPVPEIGSMPYIQYNNFDSCPYKYYNNNDIKEIPSRCPLQDL